MMSFLPELSVSAALIYSLFIAAILIYVPFGVVAYGRLRVGNDTAAPRALFDKLPPYAQRATWAHQNSFESFMLYTAAALAAYVTAVDSIWAIAAPIAYVTARFFYSIVYILNIPILRSLMFGIGSLSIGTLFVLSVLRVTGSPI